MRVVDGIVRELEAKAQADEARSARKKWWRR